MSRKYILICISLLISLFIYLFYRTSKTIVNEVVIRIVSFEAYARAKAYIVKALPLNNIVIYSLPEGLWIFCITLASKPFYIKLNNWRIDCVFIPIIYSFGLEILQFFHITNGRFDFMDIGLSFLFWILGDYVLSDKADKRNVFIRPNPEMIICLASYSIVYLSHVSK